MPPKKSVNQVPPLDLSCEDITKAIPSDKIELTDNERRHAIVGIALNNYLAPQLKPFVESEMSKYYLIMVGKYRINLDEKESCLTEDIIKDKRLGLNIYSKKSKILANIRNHNDLAKHYLHEFMSRKFTSIKNNGTISIQIHTK